MIRLAGGCTGERPHVGSHHAQPGCSVEAASGLDRAAWPIGEACWRQLRRCMVWPQWTELRAGAPECKLACRQAAPIAFMIGLARIGDVLALPVIELVDPILA